MSETSFGVRETRDGVVFYEHSDRELVEARADEYEEEMGVETTVERLGGGSR